MHRDRGADGMLHNILHHQTASAELQSELSFFFFSIFLPAAEAPGESDDISLIAAVHAPAQITLSLH